MAALMRPVRLKSGEDLLLPHRGFAAGEGDHEVVEGAWGRYGRRQRPKAPIPASGRTSPDPKQGRGKSFQPMYPGIHASLAARRVSSGMSNNPCAAKAAPPASPIAVAGTRAAAQAASTAASCTGATASR